MRKFVIYVAVCGTMLASIAVFGFIGPLLVGAVLEFAAKRHEKKMIVHMRNDHE